MYDVKWRDRIGKKRVSGEYDWRISLHKEFVDFVDEVVLLARIYDWDFWGGGVNNYAITLSQAKRDGKSISVSILSYNNYSYFVSFAKQWNPNNIKKDEYKQMIGNRMDEALKYLHSFLMENKYERLSNRDRICVLGGSYERYPLSLKWVQEELEVVGL